ncbi:helix-turn-helix transcriptional regulator [Psychrobacillus sp. NPDC096426]|uniref:helix-turn-helix transcriptional regulator n=1 Tax=Psychrobacillus sp. NPDC096426 TaxID=3364491 RepID=UPI0037FF0C2B
MIKNWQKKLFSIPQTDFVNERLFEIMKIFYEAFPCRIIQLFQYSSFNGTISGILSYEYPNVQSIAHIHQTMEINAYVHEAILDNEVRFFYDSKFQLSIGSQILQSEQVHNMILVPFSINGVVIGFMIGINVQFEVTDEVIEEMRSFSESCIHLLHPMDYRQTTLFTEKELIVMQYFTNGYTTKEISNILHIAESTVKYFLKNAMLKTNSKNRTEAVAKLFRLKLLH